METATREFRAEARFQRVSPQKARLVLDLIKGRGVEEALNTVAFTKKAVAPLVEKVLRSALQNANHLSQEQGLDVDLDNLYVKSAVANEGPRMKRIRPAPMGTRVPVSAAAVAHRDLRWRSGRRPRGWCIAWTRRRPLSQSRPRRRQQGGRLRQRRRGTNRRSM